MERYKLIKQFMFRHETVNNETILFCYDMRCDEYFIMDGCYYEVLKSLQNGSSESELVQQFPEINVSCMLKGLRYRTLVFSIHDVAVAED